MTTESRHPESSPQRDAAWYLACCNSYYAGRRERLATNLTRRQAGGIRIVPFLLHHHAPGLPGYSESRLIPVGIAPAPADEAIAPLWTEFFALASPPEQPSQADIESVAMTGDAGTSAQGEGTVFEFWIFAANHVGDSARAALRAKCASIEDWLRRACRLDSRFHVTDAQEFRLGHFDTTGTQAKPSRDRLLASMFVQAGHAVLFHASPLARESVPYDDIVTGWHRGTWTNAGLAIDLGAATAVGERELVHELLAMLADMKTQPANAVLPVALALVQLRQRGTVAMTEMVKAAFQTAPALADPFELSFDLIEAEFTDASALDRFYLRELYYLRVQPGLTRAMHAMTPTGPAESLPDAAAVAPSGLKPVLPSPAVERVRAWGWSHMTLLTLDNVALWNYRQIYVFYQALERFITFLRAELACAMQRIAHETGSTAALIERADEAAMFFRSMPAKVPPAIPYTLRPYAGAEVLLAQEKESSGRMVWRAELGVPAGRETGGAFTELTLRKGASLLANLLWLVQTGLVEPRSTLHIRALDKELPEPWCRELAASCMILRNAAAAVPREVAQSRQGRRQPLAFVLTANLSDELTARGQRSTKIVDKATSTRVVSEDRVFDYNGDGNPLLKEFTLAYATGAGELYTHNLRFDHHALARIFTLMAPCLAYDEKTRRLNVEIVVPPSGHGLNVRMALQLTLFELSKFLGGAADVTRRYITRHRGTCYVIERPPADAPARLNICRSVGELLQQLEDTGGRPVRVRIDRQVTGLERLRELYEHAVPGTVNLYIFRDADPWQVHVVDEFGGFFTDRYPVAQARGLLGDLSTFLTRYAGTRRIPCNVFDIARGKGRSGIDYVIEPAGYINELVGRRSSTMVLGLSDAQGADTRRVRVELGSSTTEVFFGPEVIGRLKAAARKTGGVAIVELPRILTFADGRSIETNSAASALRAARGIRAMLLGPV